MWLPILPNPINAIFIASLFRVDLQVAQMPQGLLWLRRKLTAVAGNLVASPFYVRARSQFAI